MANSAWMDLRRSNDELDAHVQENYAGLFPEEAQAGTPGLPPATTLNQAWLETPSYSIDEEQKRDRARGALLGLAIGDAVGTTLESGDATEPASRIWWAADRST